MDIACTIRFGAEQPLSRRNTCEGVVCRFASAAVLACIVVVASAQTSFQADADSLHAKLALVSETGDRPRDENLQPIRTSVTDREVNAYLKVYGPTFLPDGLNDPHIDFGGFGRLTTRGRVDLDAVRLSRRRDWLDPMNYMSGLVEFTATAVVTCSNGRGLASFESATLAGISVPKSIVQELVRYYTTSPAWPNGFNLDESVELPANIQSIEFDPGHATIIQ